MYIPSFLSLPPTPPPTLPSRMLQSTKLGSLCYMAAISICFTYGSLYTSMLLSVHPSLSFACCVPESVLYASVSIPTLQIGSAVSFFWIPCVCMLSCFSRVRLFETLWTAAHQAPLSMGFSRQEYRRGLPCPPPRDLPDPGIEPTSLMSPASAGGFFTTTTT